MQRFTKVSHSSDTSTSASVAVKKPSLAFLRNVVQSNAQRSATSQGLDITSSNKSTHPHSETKVSFGTDVITTSPIFSHNSQNSPGSTPYASQSAPVVKSAMKKTAHSIPISPNAFDLTQDDEPTVKKAQNSSDLFKTPSITSNATKSTPKISTSSPKTTQHSSKILPSSQPNTKLPSKAQPEAKQTKKSSKPVMMGFLSAGDLDEYQHSTALKRKLLLASGPSTVYDKKTGQQIKNTPQMAQNNTKTGKPDSQINQKTPQLKPKIAQPIKKQKVVETGKANKMVFFSANDMDSNDDHSDWSQDDSDDDEEYQQALTLMNCGVSASVVPQKATTLLSKNSKLTSNSKVQLQPLGKSIQSSKIIPKNVKILQNNSSEDEIDGFLSDNDDDDQEEEEEEPTPPPKLSTKFSKILLSTPQSLKIAPNTKKMLKPVPKQAQNDSEEEADGFLSDESDEIDGFLNDSDDNNSSNELDIDQSDSEDQQPSPPPIRSAKKSLKLSSKSEIISKPSNIIKKPLNSTKNGNTTHHNFGPAVPFITLPQIIQPDIPTTAKIPIIVYFPQHDIKASQPTSKKKSKFSGTTSTLSVRCYDMETYQNELHSLLNYPHMNPPTQSFYYTLHSEVHQRFLYTYMPAPIVPRHNLIARSSSLHNAVNRHIITLFNEEMVRRQASSSLFAKFNLCFPQLKDNSFNNYEQWCIRNLSINDKLLPQSLTSTADRSKLFTFLQQEHISPQPFMPPTQFNQNNIHTSTSRQEQRQSQLQQNQSAQSHPAHYSTQPQEKKSGENYKKKNKMLEIDVLLGSSYQTCLDRELREQLQTRGMNIDQINQSMNTYQRAVEKAVEDVKHAQAVFAAKGCPPKDSVIKVSEDINKSTMNLDIAVLYDHIREFDKVSITFHTPIGQVQLSIPHCVKLIILYVTTMVVNYCFDDAILTKILQLSPHSDEVSQNGIGGMDDEEMTPQAIKKHDYKLLNDIISMASPQLLANFTPLVQNNSNVINNVHSSDSDDEISKYDQSLETFSSQIHSPQLTSQVAHILARIQEKLPPQSILSQYIAMFITGYTVTPKIPNLKIPNTPLHTFPPALAQAIVTTLFRYDALHGGQYKSGGGNQAAVPPRFLQQCHALLNINIEAFASPLNTYFNTYCSAFADTDTPFGSLGSFFHFKPQSGCIFVNPPFASNTILASIIHAEQLLAYSERQGAYDTPLSRLIANGNDSTLIQAGAKRINDALMNTTDATSNDGLMFMFVFPCKDDELYTQWIKSSPYCTMYTILPARSHIYTVGRQETNVNKKQAYRPARHDSILVTLQNKPSKAKTPITERIVKDLLKYFLVNIPAKNLKGADIVE